ncbi:anti-sigma factor family protein [Microvirga pakistanensis]|uniref:anti-sigma factor family protein n=1 Tax=Microvirga pakistanensis TaxID=1682650 RepID=UPI00106B817C|nr:hypothetical protein [Microvirga pakistanensis]
MAQFHFSDEILMAFADGELDEQMAGRVEQAMANDPAIARRIAEFLRSRRLIRSAYARSTASDVPPALRAAVQAQIDRLEAQAGPQAPSGDPISRSASPAGRWRPALALAAGIGALALATGGYLAGRQGLGTPSADPIAYLAAPEVSRALGSNLSGQEQDLPFGRIRVISTYRMADGSLCREFKLETSAGASNAVACRGRDWKTTFALASADASGSYVPSDGADLVDSYLQKGGAGQPLLDAAEVQALREPPRLR